MEFHNLKRRELQLLCRKHQIPANLTNLEMAERLTALSAVDEKKPLTRGRRPCLKSADDIANGNESDLEVRPAKKVKFSPDNETIEFEKSAIRYSQVNGGRRGKSAMSGDKGSAEKVNEEFREPSVSGRGKFGGVKAGAKGGKRGKKVDASKSSEVVADRVTRQARRRLLMAGIGVEGRGRKVTKGEVIEGTGTTSDVTEGGGTKARRGKSFEGNGPGIKGKKTAKADSSEDKAPIQNVENADTRPKRGRTSEGMLVASETGKMAGKIEASKADSLEDKATIQNVENEDMRPKRGRPKKGTTSEGMLVASKTGKMAEKVEASKPDSSEDKPTIQNVENEDTRPKRGRPRKRRTSEGRLVASETGKMAAKVEASKDKELVDDGLNENAKQVRRSRRGKSPEGVQIDGQAGKRAIIVETLEENGLVNGGVTGEVKRLTRSRRGKSPEGMQIEGKTGNRATKVEALEDDLVDDGATGEVKGVRRSRRGKSPEEMQVESKPAKMVSKDEALKSKGVVIDGSNEDRKKVKSVKVPGKELAKDAVIDKGLVDTGLSGDAKDARQSRRGKSAAGMQAERMAENKVAKDEGLRDKGPVDDGLHGDAKEVRRSRRGKSAEGMQVESKAVKKLKKDEASKDKGHADDAKEVRRSRRGKSPEGMQVETKAGKKVMENETLTDKGLIDYESNVNAKVVRSSRRGKSPERHIESKTGKKVTKDEVSKDQGIAVDDGLNGDAKDVRSSRRGKSPEATKVKRVTMDDSIKDKGLVDGLSVDAMEARRISRRRNFTASSGVSEGKPSAAGDMPSTNIQNEEHTVVKKPLLSKREASTVEREQNGGVRKRSKKSSNVTSKEDCEAASGSKEAVMEVADVQISGVNISKIVDVKECSPAESKLRRSQRSASKLELSVQSTTVVSIRNSKMETRKKGGAVLEFETHTTQESSYNRRLSKKNALSTGKGEIPVPAAETEKSAEEEEIRSMGNTEAENTSNVDIPADLEAQAASIEGPTKTNIEDEDTSNVDIPLDLDAQAILAEDPMGRNIEVEGASNVAISADFDAQATLAENPSRVNIEVVDTSNVDIPADLEAQAASIEGPTKTNIEDEDTSNVDIPLDPDAHAVLAENPTGRNIEVEDASNVAISANFDAQAALAENPARVNIEVVDTSNVDISAGLDAQAASAENATKVNIEVVDTSNVDIPADLDAQAASVGDPTRAFISVDDTSIVEVEDISNGDIRADIDAEAAAIEAQTDSVCDNGIDAQLSANLPQFETESNSLVGQTLTCEENSEANDYLAMHIRTPLMAEENCYNSNLECLGELDEQPEDVSASTNSEAHSHEEINEGHDSQTTLIKTPLTAGKDCSDGNSELVIDESVMQQEDVLESINSEAHSDKETAEGNDSQTKNIRTPSTAENDSVDGDLELTDDMDKHHETSIESPNSEPLSQTTHTTTPLTARKDHSTGNSVLVCVQNEVVLKSRNSEAHEERAGGNDSQTKNIRTPSTAENVCADGDLELTNDLDKHHETAIESTSEAHSHEGNKSQTKHMKTPLTEEKDCGDSNLELGIDYLDKQHGSILESINSDAHSNEERYDGNDSQISLIAEKDCVKQREEVSPIKMKDCGAHYSSTTLTNFHHPDTSSFEDTKTDEIESSKIAAENSEKLLEHESPDAIGRSASEILLDRHVSCCEDIAHSSGMQGDMLYYTEPSAERVETETKFSGGVFDTKSRESVQTSPSLGLNGKTAGEASKAGDLETHFVMSAQSPSEQNRGAQPNLDQGVHAAKSNEHEDFGHSKPQDNDLEFSLESREENSSYYKSTSDARTNICDTQDQVEEPIAACDTQDQVEEPIAACDTQSVAFSPGGEGTQIFDGGEGYGVCNEAKIKEGSVSVEAVFMTNTPSSGGDAEIVKGTVSMDRSSDVEANALDDQPALRMEGEASCLEENNERKDSKTTYMRTPLTPEKDHMDDEYDKQHAAVGENTISEAHCTSPCEVNEEVRLQNSEGTERMQPNLEALKYSELENSEILIDAYDVGSSYSVNDGQAEAMQMQTILNANESKQEDDNTMLMQPAEVLSMQMNSCGMSAALENYEHLEIDSFEDLKSVECDSLKIVPKNPLETVGRSTSINELQGDVNNGENIMQGEVLAFNEPSAKSVGIVSEFSGIADDSGTESFRNSYAFDWDGFETDINAGVHGFSFGSNIPPEDCEEGYRYPLDDAKVLEEEQGTSLFETQVNEHQLNTNETVKNIQAPDVSEASVSRHYPLFSASEVSDLLSEMRSDDQSCASQPEKLDQGLLETAAGSILETEAHPCTGNADEAPDHNLVSNYKSDSTIGNTLGGAASETISSAVKNAQKSKNARSILIHGTPRRQPATAHPKENASVSKVDKVGSLTSVRTAKPPPSARKPWK